MEAKEIILKSLEESQEYLNKALDRLTEEEIAWAPGAESNSIAFILWHVARTEDTWVNGVIQGENEIYDAGGWQERLGTPPKESGYSYTKEQLQAWPVPKLELLRGYADSVREKTMAVLQSITAEKLSETVGTGPVRDTRGVILAHLITEIALHVGQIHYLHGLHRGLDSPEQ